MGLAAITRSWALGLVLGASVCASAVTEAQAVAELNIVGAESVRHVAPELPLNLCDQTPSLPERYSSADGTKVTWHCQRGGQEITIRYSATRSFDGLSKLLPVSDPPSNMPFLDPDPTGCTGPFLETRLTDGKQYNNRVNCGNVTITSRPVDLGSSVALGTSFHQTGPLGTTVGPQDPTHSLSYVDIAVIPYSLFVGKGVVKVAGRAPAGPITSLSREQVEGIFSGAVTDWRRLGYGTVTDAAPNTLEPASPITLCRRAAGSGAKAAFDETVMINARESIIPPFNTSTQQMITCLAAPGTGRRSIGYLPAEDVESFTSGNAYVVRLNDAWAYNPSLSDPKQDLKCGIYDFWTYWRLYSQRPIETSSLAAAYVAVASDPGLAGFGTIQPYGKYWAGKQEMAVFKNDDRGPLGWKAGAHPDCQ